MELSPTARPQAVVPFDDLEGQSLDRSAVARLALLWAGVSLAVAAAAAVVPGITVEGGIPTYLWIAALFASVNVVIGAFLRIALPLIWLTLGVLGLVVDAAVLVVVDGMVGSLEVDGFGAALLGSLVMSLLTVLVCALVFVHEHRSPTTDLS